MEGLHTFTLFNFSPTDYLSSPKDIKFLTQALSMIVRKLLMLIILFFGWVTNGSAQTESELLEQALREQGIDTERLLQLYEQVQAADGFNEAEGYRMLGEVYPKYRSLQQAEATYDAALASDDPQEITQLATQLAQQQTSGLRTLQRGLIRLRSLPPSDTLRRAAALLHLERAYLLQEEQQWEKAEQDLEEALQTLGATGNETLGDPLDWLDPTLALEALLTRYRSPLGPTPDATTLEARLEGLEHSLQLLHHLRHHYERESDRLAMAEAVPPLAYRAVVIALQLEHAQPQRASYWEGRAFTLAEQAKATLLADRLQGLQLVRNATDWPALDQHLRLARQLKLASGDFYEQPAELRSLAEEILPQLSAWPIPPQRSLSIDLIHQQLREEKAVMVSYFITGEQCIVFTLDDQEIHTDYIEWLPRYQQALASIHEELTSRHFMREPEQAFQTYTQAAFLLYETLLQRPALSRLNDQPDQLIILPDGALWDLPFGTLLASEPASNTPNYQASNLNYLAFRHAISYIPSAWVWSYQQQEVLRSKQEALAAFAPTFDGQEVAERSLCGGPLPYLPHSQQEAEAVLQFLPGDAFLGEQATRDAFLQAGQTSSVLHIATHACRDEANPARSAIYFQNGALMAQEIAAIPLPSNLTVLSACETQSGTYLPGEGALSIGRAFLHAGSRSLIGSLWPVSDAATAELIPLFYEGISEALPTGQALQQARARYLERQDRLTAHPHYWAGFVLVGQNEILTPSGGMKPWWWLALGIGAILFIFVRSKRPQTMRKLTAVALLLSLSQLTVSAQEYRIAVTDFQTGGRPNIFGDVVRGVDTDVAREEYRQVQQYVMEVFLENNRFVLLDRSQLAPLDQERELQRDEDFLEGYVVEQFSAVGADYLLSGRISRRSHELTLSLFTIGDQALIGQQSIPLRVGWLSDFQSTRRAVQDGTRQFIASYFPSEIPVIRVLKGNGRAREVLIAGGQNHGLRNRLTLSVKVEELEEVNGEEIPRLITIAEIKVEEVENENFSRCSVRSGGRALYEYLELDRRLIAIPLFE